MKLFNKIGFFLLPCISLLACTKLDEKLNSSLTFPQAQQVADVKGLLQAAYDALQAYQDPSANISSLSENSTDESLVPTRGPDWDDNGVWRAVHAHTWTSSHSQVINAFNDLLGISFNATNVLQFKPSAQQAAEARFIRAFADYSVLDLYGQVPYRDAGEDLGKPSRVFQPADALAFIISEVNAIMNDLPDGSPSKAYIANKNAAKVLLMKCYLNKGAFLNRATPTFDAGDMTQVVTLADQIINTGNYSLSANVFDNYTPNNDVTSTENIFTSQNIGGVRGGNIRGRWFSWLHYNQNPSGWNGFCTLVDVYNKFEATDTRRGGSYTGMTDVSGIKTGLLLGQQYDQNNVALKDRKGNPLAFTANVNLVEKGNDLEVTGIRVNRYVIDYKSGDANQADNDCVLYRYADVLLMKAEALLRSGNSAAALTIVNQLRVQRGASSLATLDLPTILDERQRELYADGWRRQDLIRFGAYLQPWGLKPSDDPKNLLFPIPSQQLAVNPNLHQNPGYN